MKSSEQSLNQPVRGKNGLRYNKDKDNWGYASVVRNAAHNL